MPAKKKKRTTTKKRRKKKVTRKAAAKKKAAKTRKRTTKKTRTKKKVAKKKARKKKKVTAKKTTKKKPAAKKRPQKAAAKVSIANNVGQTLVLKEKESALQSFAMRWRYVLSRRLRWKKSSRKEMRSAAFKAISGFSSESAVRNVLGEASVVEVQVPYVDEKTGWEGRVTPWEFLLASAARESGNRDPMAIVRWLKVSHAAAPLPPDPRVLYVECAPGFVSDIYDFSSERGTLESIFPGSVTRCLNPSIEKLSEKTCEKPGRTSSISPASTITRPEKFLRMPANYRRTGPRRGSSTAWCSRAANRSISWDSSP